MYPRNATSPPRISVGAVVQISDGAVQTAGVSVVVRPEGGIETAGAGTVSYGASSGVVYYAPTQAETNHTAFVVVAYKAGCIPAEKTVVTSESTVSGRVYVQANGDKTGYALSTAGVNAIADQVWDEDYSQHNIAGSFGKLMNLLRKANQLLEATVLASPAPSTTSFTVSGLNYPSGAFTGAVLMWDGGASLAEQNSPILSYVNNGDGTSLITIEQAFTSAPVAGDLALIIPTTHVHSVAEIQAGLSTLTAGQVNAQVLDVLTVDVFGELAAVPGASSTLKDKIAFLFMLARNKVTQTASTQTLFADNTTTPVAAATTSDVGGTFTRGEFT